jgi:hypothetical protein
MAASKISGDGPKDQARRSFQRLGSPFERISRAPDGRHPVDIAVDKRLSHGARRKWIIKLQDRIMVVMGSHAGLFLKLERMLNEQQRDREKCFFDVGYEYGQTDANAGEASTSNRVEMLARALRERILQENIPANEVTVALLQCALAVAKSQRS